MKKKDRIINAGWLKKTYQVSQRWKVYDPEGIAPTLCSMTRGGGYNIQPKIIIEDEEEDHKQ